LIQINKFVEPIVTILDPNGNSIGECTNAVEFADVRRQIAEEGAEGYSVKFNDEVIPITKYGTLDWPNGLYDKEMIITAALFRAQRILREEEK
jgi:hypothetical protein